MLNFRKTSPVYPRNTDLDALRESFLVLAWVYCPDICLMIFPYILLRHINLCLLFHNIQPGLPRSLHFRVIAMGKATPW
jgi:hypothetical protein